VCLSYEARANNPYMSKLLDRVLERDCTMLMNKPSFVQKTIELEE